MPLTAPAPEARPQQPDLRRAKRLLWACALGLLLLASSGVALKIDSEQMREIAAIERANQSLVRALEEQTLHTLQGVDQALQYLKQQYERHPERRDLGYGHGGQAYAGLFSQFGIIDEAGRYILSGRPGRQTADLSERECFRVHIPRDTGQLFISKPVLGRASGQWSIQFTRRINKPDGSFGGVVVASLDPRYFTRLHAEAGLGPNGVITLLGMDGIVRARDSGNDRQVGQSLVGSALLAAASLTPAGTLAQASSIDRIERFFAYRRLADYPLMVVVGTWRELGLAEVRRRAWGYMAGGTLFGLAVLACAWAGSMRLGRLAASRADPAHSAHTSSPPPSPAG